MKILEQSQAKLATQYISMPWLFLIGWCCHLLSIGTLLILCVSATDMAKGNRFEQSGYASNDKSFPQPERVDWAAQ